MATITRPGYAAPAPTAVRRPLGGLPLWRLALVGPAVLFLLVLFAYPVARIAVLSVDAPHFTGKFFVAFFTAPVYSTVLYQTYRTAVVVTAVCLLLGYPVAYLMTRSRPRAARLLLILVLLPFWVSLLVRTYAWMIILGRGGLINQVLLELGIVNQPVQLMFNTLGVVIGMTHILLPFMVLPLFSVMRQIDQRLLQAAANLGATPARAFWTVFCPLSLPGVGAGCLLVFIQSLGFFVTPALLGGSGDAMIAQLIANQVQELVNWQFASAQAVVLLVSAIVVLAIFNRVLGLERVFSTKA
jgi:putative spermidine/putrescine transport system permease protein